MVRSWRCAANSLSMHKASRSSCSNRCCVAPANTASCLEYYMPRSAAVGTPNRQAARRGELNGQISVTQLALAGPWAGDDRLRLASISVPCSLVRRGESSGNPPLRDSIGRRAVDLHRHDR